MTEDAPRKRGRPPGPRKIRDEASPTISKVKRVRAAPKPKGKPGRPPWQPTDEQRLEVCRLTSVGVTAQAIAQRFGIKDETLATHCAKELNLGRNISRAELVMMLWEAAGKGNVAAMKRLDEMQAAAGATAEIKADASDHADRQAQARLPALGKKEQQREAAATAGIDSEWGSDLAITPAMGQG